MNNANQLEPVSNNNARRVVVAAASARALAASSLRGGRPVSTIDLFADADTVAICEESNRHLLSGQPHNFSWHCDNMDDIFVRVEQLLDDPDFSGQSGPPMILVGGGLENYFQNHTISQKLMQQTRASVFYETARWRNVNEFCHQNSVQFPTTTLRLNAHQAKQRWLLKTDFSSGGLGVQFADANAAPEHDQYFQKYIDGQSISACFVAAPVVAGEKFPAVEMLGVCEPVAASGLEVCGRASGQPLPFRYAGSIGPICPSRLMESTLAELKRVGILVANHFGLAGIFGIDFVLEQDHLWLLEINPRITASAELIEYAAGQTMPDFSLIQLHLDALSGNVDPRSPLIEACQNANVRDRIFAKRIVFRHHDAAQTLRVTPSLIESMELQFGQFAGGRELPPASGAAFITDVPKPKTDIVAGHPILTFHVSGESYPDVEQTLARGLEVLERILGEQLA